MPQYKHKQGPRTTHDATLPIHMLHTYVQRLGNSILTYNSDAKAEEERHRHERQLLASRYKTLKLRCAKAMARADRLMHQAEQGALLETSKSTTELIKRLLTPSEFAAVVEIRTRQAKAALERKIAMQGKRHGRGQKSDVGGVPAPPQQPVDASCVATTPETTPVLGR